jgi:hypothetical protein
MADILLILLNLESLERSNDDHHCICWCSCVDYRKARDERFSCTDGRDHHGIFALKNGLYRCGLELERGMTDCILRRRQRVRLHIGFCGLRGDDGSCEGYADIEGRSRDEERCGAVFDVCDGCEGNGDDEGL